MACITSAQLRRPWQSLALSSSIHRYHRLRGCRRHYQQHHEILLLHWISGRSISFHRELPNHPNLCRRRSSRQWRQASHYRHYTQAWTSGVASKHPPFSRAAPSAQIQRKNSQLRQRPRPLSKLYNEWYWRNGGNFSKPSRLLHVRRSPTHRVSHA